MREWGRGRGRRRRESRSRCERCGVSGRGRRDRDRTECDATVGDGGDDDSEATILRGRRNNGDGRGDGDVDEDQTARATRRWGGGGGRHDPKAPQRGTAIDGCSAGDSDQQGARETGGEEIEGEAKNRSPMGCRRRVVQDGADVDDQGGARWRRGAGSSRGRQILT